MGFLAELSARYGLGICRNGLAATLLAGIVLPAFALGADTPLRFVAPADQAELDARVKVLREQYEPFLRSLPPALPRRPRTELPKEWKFTYEAKESPKVEAIPPAPEWQGADFNDAAWETTTVPEWRYRTREGDDHAVEPQVVGAWRNKQKSADTICWYRTTFKAAPPAEGRRLWLCFDGVEWEAQVWLNGERLGTHSVYYEPFRFDVTAKLKERNTLAVRVISGRSYGQPVSYWAVFPDSRAAKQRYVPDRAQSLPGLLPIGYHAACGYGIFRDVYLEETGPVLVSAVFARNDLSAPTARVKIELDRAEKRPVKLRVDVLPENFEGPACTQTLTADAETATLEIPMPDARTWSPDAPHLYRCRVTAQGSDARDVLFGCRSFSLIHQPQGAPAPANNLQPGTLLLNGKPVYLRGTNIQGLNAYAYWGEKDLLLHTLMLLKAAHFNTVRSCQHIEFPEVLDWMDRVGLLSEQDQGGGHRGSIDMGIRRQPHIHTGTVLARETYNHPGVVLLSFGNEHEFPAEPIVRAALAVDPQRIFKPISGRFSHSKKAWDLPDDLRANALDDGHNYAGWYGNVVAQTWSNLKILPPARLVTIGEFGAEALDAYETMRDHYPPQFKPPAPDADVLWGASQVQKHDVKMITGLGRDPKNLAEYIEASQNYQEALMADKVTGMRLSPRAVAGYFHFHFIDVLPVFWPKSIVSHDHRPKKAYYQFAQLNQPVVALPQLQGERPDRVTLWVANDLSEGFSQARLRWTVSAAGQTLLEGQQTLDVPEVGTVQGETLDLGPIVSGRAAFDLELLLSDSEGRPISKYRRQVRTVPAELLKKSDAAEDGSAKPKKK